MKYIKTNSLITYSHIDEFDQESFVNSVTGSEFYYNTKYAFGVRILNNDTGRFDILPYFTFLQISLLNQEEYVKHVDNMFEEMYNITLEFFNDPYYHDLDKFSVELFTFKCFYRKKSDTKVE